MKSVAMLFVVLIALVGLPAHVTAQGIDVHVTVLGHADAVAGDSSDHFLTFSGPVGVPGVGLAPGTYIFRLVAPTTLQVLSENRSMVYGMFLMTSIQRDEVTSGYTVTLEKTRKDTPARIVTIFPPHASTGYEFTYPKTEIAAADEVARE
jgi:hypothetical protein